MAVKVEIMERDDEKPNTVSSRRNGKGNNNYDYNYTAKCLRMASLNIENSIVRPNMRCSL